MLNTIGEAQKQLIHAVEPKEVSGNGKTEYF